MLLYLFIIFTAFCVKKLCCCDIKNVSICDIWVAESSVEGLQAASLGEGFPAFRRTVEYQNRCSSIQVLNNTGIKGHSSIGIQYHPLLCSEDSRKNREKIFPTCSTLPINVSTYCRVWRVPQTRDNFYDQITGLRAYTNF